MSLAWWAWFWKAHWKDCVDVLTAIGTLAAAWAAWRAVQAARESVTASKDIAARQEQLVKQQLKQDLFDKRYDLFREFMMRTSDTKRADKNNAYKLGDIKTELLRLQHRAQFLFGPDVLAQLDVGIKVVDELLDMSPGPTDTAGRLAILAKLAPFQRKADEVVKPYLQLGDDSNFASNLPAEDLSSAESKRESGG